MWIDNGTVRKIEIARYAIFNALLEFSVRFKVSGNFFIDESQRFGKNISKNSKKISIKMHFSNFQFRYII